MYDVTLTQSHFPPQDNAELRQTTVGSVLRDAAGADPERLALVEIGEDAAHLRRWTYAELLADAERLALALSTRYRTGERIVIWAPNIPEWILCEFGLALAGVTLVTANPGYQPRELKYVCEQSGATGLFFVDNYRGNPMGDIARAVAQELPAIREAIDLQDHEALFARGDGAAELPPVEPMDIAQIQYTSGSTGFPKGVLLHHYGLTNNSRHIAEVAGTPPKGRAVLVAPLFHTAGCSCAVLGTVQNVGTIYMPPLFDPHLTNTIIENERIEVINGVPTMIMMMLEADDAVKRDLTSLELIGVGGSMVAPELVRRAEARTGANFTTVYGLTETFPIMTGTGPGDNEQDRCETVGQPYPQVEVSIRDPHDNGVMPLDTVGEICSRGYNVMAGYNDNPEATAETIDADGWLHTGDLGRMDSRGFVTITGRVKEMIIRGGENLYPVEIENALLEHPDVAQVAVVGLPDDSWGEIVAAFVRPRDGAEFDPQALKAHCRSLLAAQKTPSIWIRVSEYPMTGSGKIQKFQLRDAYLAGAYETE